MRSASATGAGPGEGGSIKAFLVDLDGTLADTAEASFQAYSQALAERGRPGPPAIGGPAPDASVRPRVRFNDALVVMLRQSHRSGVQLALVTTASAAHATSVLAARPDIAALFSLRVTADDIRHPKPHPEAYCLAASRLGLAPHECLVIEDSQIGLAAGRAFGAAVLRVSMDGLR